MHEKACRSNFTRADADSDGLRRAVWLGIQYNIINGCEDRNNCIQQSRVSAG